MKKITIFLLSVFVFISCEEESEPKSTCYSGSYPPRNTQKVTVEQGIWGDVWFWSGDFMPSDPPSNGEICQVERTVLIYELTTTSDVDKVGYTSFYTAIHTQLISSVESDNQGFFQIQLEPGIYSIFVQEDDKYYSNLFSGSGEIFPVTVESGKVSEVRFDITYEATY